MLDHKFFICLHVPNLFLKQASTKINLTVFLVNNNEALFLKNFTLGRQRQSKRKN